MIFNTIIKGKGGITGEPIDVAELPTPSADTVGKVYAVDTKVTPEVGQVVGDKLYFDTSKNPLDYPQGSAIVMGGTESGVHCTYVDFFELQGITGMGHCYAIGVASEDMSVFLGMPYVYCDVLTVAQFNANVGSQLGVSISAFGWQTDVVDITSIQDRKITYVYAELDFVKVKGKDYYIGITDNSFRMNEPVGDKIYFDTTKNPLAYGQGDLLRVSKTGEITVALGYFDFFVLQDVTGMGACYIMAVASTDLSALYGVAYVYCDILTVEQFNANVGSQFGFSITEFGWQTDVIDMSAVADYVVTDNYLYDWDFLAYGNNWYDWELSNQSIVDKVEAEKDAEIANVTAEKDAEIANVTAEKDDLSTNFMWTCFQLLDTSAGWDCIDLSILPEPETGVVGYSGYYFGYYCFYQRSMTSVKMPKHITRVSARCFYACYKLEELDFSLVETVPETDASGAIQECPKLTTIKVPSALLEQFKAAEGWSNYADIIQADHSTIATVTVNYTVDGNDHGVMGDTAPETVAYGSNFAFQVDCEQGYAVDTSSIVVTGATLAYTQIVYEPDGVTVVPESLRLAFTDVTGDVTINMTLKQY